MWYLLLKTIHIISSTLLFGTGLGSAYYMWRAHLTGKIPVIATTVKHVVTADWLFTSTTIIIQLVTGIWMVLLANYSFTWSWILWSLLLYGLAGACWLPVVWIQLKIRDLAQQAVLTDTHLPSLYYRYMRLWFLLGWPAFISLVVVFCLMVFKPI